MPFVNAIDLKSNLVYLKYSSIPLAIIACVLLLTPGVISEPAERIIQHRSAFVQPAPFRFEVVSSPLACPKGGSFEFLVRVLGETVPSTVYLVDEGGRYRMERVNDGVFSFTFSNIYSDKNFKCTANGVDSPNYTLLALPVPSVSEYSIVATPPAYTGLDKIVQTNHGDLFLPEGSVVEWDVTVLDAERLSLRFSDTVLLAQQVVGGRFNASLQASSSSPYWMVASNNELGAVDSLRFSLGVISDARPVITVAEVEDSISRGLRYFSGNTSDDYGFSRLRFVYRVSGETEFERITLDLPRGKSDSFYYTWDISGLGLMAGQSVEYWFEVTDNDSYNGPKSSKTATRVFSAPSEEELKDEVENANEEIESSLSDALRQAAELKEEIDAFKERLREERELDWKDERALEELVKKQEELQKTIDSLSQANENKNSRRNEFSKQEERILEKQQELQKLMEEVMSDELKKLYDQMQEMLQDLSPEELQEQLDQMDVGQEALEKELDRALEQFKQLEWEVKWKTPSLS